ncbi:TIR-only protein-like [Diospyros lotus]|uniref:TIR-only protein-like n=1 Tax=Diospyros lotus TaxID=55363 RepID=UPI002253FA89|nr:TIR-only protein-like [Diospyros lotus]
MYRSRALATVQAHVLCRRSPAPAIVHELTPPYDVVINHRAIDTQQTVASLLYDHLRRLNLRPFLYSKNMKPGDKLPEKIDRAILGCKIGVAVFSPRYCESHFCLRELAMIMESRKKVIPIFCDVKPSKLRVIDNGSVSPEEMGRFRSALEEAKYTVGFNLDSIKGNWSDVVTNAADIVIDSLMEVEEEERIAQHQKSGIFSSF